MSKWDYGLWDGHEKLPVPRRCPQCRGICKEWPCRYCKQKRLDLAHTYTNDEHGKLSLELEAEEETRRIEVQQRSLERSRDAGTYPTAQ